MSGGIEQLYSGRSGWSIDRVTGGFDRWASGTLLAMIGVLIAR